MLCSVMVNSAMRYMRYGYQLAAARPRRVIVMVVVILLALATLGGTVVRTGGHVPALGEATRVWSWGRVYTVADVERGLAQDTGGWAGRTVLVRGRAVIYHTWSPPDSIVTRLALVDPGGAGATQPLPLRWGDADPLLARLRTLALLRRLLPPPQRLAWDRPAIYRLTLDAIPCALPHHWTCYGGLLLDADPRGA